MFLSTNIEHVITTLSTVKIYVNIGHMSTRIYKHHKLQTNEINDRKYICITNSDSLM
jgi:hypothetical protein